MDEIKRLQQLAGINEIKVNPPIDLLSLWQQIELKIYEKIRDGISPSSLLIPYNNNLIKSIFSPTKIGDRIYTTNPSNIKSYQEFLNHLNDEQKNIFYIKLKKFKQDHNL